MADFDNSDAGSDVETERGVSEGVSEDSGISDDLGGGMHRRVTKEADRRVTRTIGALAFKQAALCSMCDTEASQFLCVPCGHLTFCLKCCVSLHDNRFLGGHTVNALTDNAELSIAALKEMSKAKLEVVKPARPPPRDHLAELEALPKGSSQGRSPDRVSVQNEEPELDLPALAADQNIIQARLKELTHMSDSLRKLGIELSQEIDATRETTSTAVEAVKRKFDILRNLINAKEQEFVAVVQDAGKSRLDAATKGQIDANVVVSELHGYVAHSENQLDRLKGNRRLFNQSRRPMLESSEKKLSEAEEAMHRLQDRLDNIRSLSLGIHISLEEPVEAIQRLQAPSELSVRKLDPPHVLPVPAKQFVESPTAKVFIQTAPKPLSDDRPPLLPVVGTPVRQSFAKEVESLRQSPMPNRANSPMRVPGKPTAAQPQVAASAAQPLAREPSGNSQLAPAAGGGPIEAQKSSTLIARAAARRTSPTRQHRSMFPPELEALRKQVSGSRSLATNSPLRSAPSAAAGGGTASNGLNSPTVRMRAGTPTRRPLTDSPRKEATPTAASVAVSHIQRASYDNVPGPGSYNYVQPFGSRAFLSTPPRRR